MIDMVVLKWYTCIEMAKTNASFSQSVYYVCSGADRWFQCYCSQKNSLTAEQTIAAPTLFYRSYLF